MFKHSLWILKYDFISSKNKPNNQLMNINIIIIYCLEYILIKKLKRTMIYLMPITLSPRAWAVWRSGRALDGWHPNLIPSSHWTLKLLGGRILNTNLWEENDNVYTFIVYSYEKLVKLTLLYLCKRELLLCKLREQSGTELTGRKCFEFWKYLAIKNNTLTYF